MVFGILGSHPKLSCAELRAVVGGEVACEGQVALFSFEGDGVALQKRLGGMVKVGQVEGQMARFDAEKIQEWILEVLRKDEREGKQTFGISVYGKMKDARMVGRMGMEVKKALKEEGRSVRFVRPQEGQALSSVVVKTQGLITRGGEFVVAQTADGWVMGRTLAVQDFEDWGRRDFGRPARDAKRGMLPPKLARMMVNLTGLSNGILLDPFCGSGTVLMEAAQVGFKNLIGSDASAQAVEDARKNLAWIAGTPDATITLTAARAQDVLVDTAVDAIVTEPYLGPPLSGRETKKQLQDNVRELLALYERSFSHLVTLLMPGGVMVVAFPFFLIGKEQLDVPVESLFVRLKLQQVLAEDYRRPDQHVGRRIMVLRRA